MRILVIGASGQLGTEFKRLFTTGISEIGKLPPEYDHAEVIYTERGQLDISDADAVDDYFSNIELDLVINCAAMTNVDGCEIDEDAAFNVNAKGAGTIASAAKKAGAAIVYISTDYVFSGENSDGYIETDPVSPLSAYARSKLAGEVIVAQENPKHYIIRTAWLYGYSGKNFVKTMRALAREHDYVTVVDDQFGNPTNANDLAYAILKIALTSHYGIWHVTNTGVCSWADFAEAILLGTDCSVERCTTSDYRIAHPSSARRPAYSSLRSIRLDDLRGFKMRSWQDALSMYLSNLPDCQS